MLGEADLPSRVFCVFPPTAGRDTQPGEITQPNKVYQSCSFGFVNTEEDPELSKHYSRRWKYIKLREVKMGSSSYFKSYWDKEQMKGILRGSAKDRIVMQFSRDISPSLQRHTALQIQQSIIDSYQEVFGSVAVEKDLELIKFYFTPIEQEVWDITERVLKQ